MIKKDELKTFLYSWDREDLMNDLEEAPSVEGWVNEHQDELKKLPGLWEVVPMEDTPLDLTPQEANDWFQKDDDKLKEYYKRVDESKTKDVDVDKSKAELAEQQRQKDVNEYQHSYLGMDTKNPVNKALNTVADFIISDDTRRAIAEDPENTARITGNAVVDIGGTAADFIPGLGGVVVGPTMRTARNIAEGHDPSSILKDAALDYGANLILSKGVKGVDGIHDLGPVHAIEDRFTKLKSWEEQADRAAQKRPATFKNWETPKTRSKATEQINNLPADKKEPLKATLEQTPGRADKIKWEDTLKKIKEADAAADRNIRTARKWAKEHPVKAATGAFAGKSIQGAEKTTIHKTLESKLPKKEYAEGYDKALDSVIANNKRQWQAGFRPKAIDGDIRYEAWKKWIKEK